MRHTSRRIGGGLGVGARPALGRAFGARPEALPQPGITRRPLHRRALRARRRRPASSPKERWSPSARKEDTGHNLTGDPDLHHNLGLDSNDPRNQDPVKPGCFSLWARERQQFWLVHARRRSNSTNFLDDPRPVTNRCTSLSSRPLKHAILARRENVRQLPCTISANTSPPLAAPRCRRTRPDVTSSRT